MGAVLGIATASLEGKLLGSLKGALECCTVGASLDIILGKLDESGLGSVDGTSD